jgi:hypothetical protein
MKNTKIEKSNKAEIIIRKTYYDEGKIVFLQKQIDYKLLPKSACPVQVFKGKNGNDYFETNIVITTNNSVRINDVKVKDWFDSEKLKIGDTFYIEIIDKTTFRIHK